MGYRSRLGRVEKVERNKFLNKTCDECEAILEASFPDGDAGALYRPYFHEQFIELGKYCEFEIQPEPFYNGFNIEQEMECEFHILTKEGLHQIIKEYHQNVALNYKELLEALEAEDPDIEDVKAFLYRRSQEWDLEQCEMYLNSPHAFEMYPYYLNRPVDKRDGFIAQSWQYEYQIFNLTYIYSTFDWDNDYLIYSAW